ncbi:hypothetical protein V1524DRAFT_455928 [Lipomyces starkeyi]
MLIYELRNDPRIVNLLLKANPPWTFTEHRSCVKVVVGQMHYLGLWSWRMQNEGVLVTQDIEVETATKLNVVQLMMESDNGLEERIRKNVEDEVWLSELVKKLEERIPPETRDEHGYSLIDGLVYKDSQLCVPDEEVLRSDILSSYHDSFDCGTPWTYADLRSG